MELTDSTVLAYANVKMEQPVHTLMDRVLALRDGVVSCVICLAAMDFTVNNASSRVPVGMEPRAIMWMDRVTVPMAGWEPTVQSHARSVCLRVRTKWHG